MNRTVRIAATMVAFALVGSSAAYAQATRTWVSGVGDDANPCSRTAPCKTFAGAISKTQAGGEISVLDPGGFGGVTITKSITINGTGTLAHILVGAGANGVIINAAATDTVTLRNIALHGVGATLDGIRCLNAAALIVDGVDISGIAQDSIDIESATSIKVSVRNTTIRGGATGIQVSGPSHVNVDNVAIRNAASGIDAQAGSVNVIRSVISGNTFVGFMGTIGSHTIHDSLVTNNNVGLQAQPGATMSMSGNSLVDNTFGFGCGGGTMASTGDNRVVNNPSGGCPPGAVITVQ
jgi:hypothetical protein